MDKEIVVVELSPEGRLRLDQQLKKRAKELGYSGQNWSELQLGFDLPEIWPIDKDCEITMPQLVVLACKLKMQIIIGDINLERAPADSQGKSNRGG